MIPTLLLAGCASKPKAPAPSPRASTARAVEYQKEKSHFMNVGPAIVIGRFRLKDRYCTESTYWYSNLLDYTRSRPQTNALSGPALGKELVLAADYTYTVPGEAGGDASGTYALLEQGPTRIVAVTKSAGDAKGVPDSQAHHRIELSLKAKDGPASRTLAVDLVNSGYEQLVLVEETPRANCESGDSLNLVYERVKP